MSGWIKLEKDLLTDVRLRRMLAHLETTPLGVAVTHGRYGRDAGVTLLLGALARLWMYADAFARDDDTINLTAADIDELTGIENFTQLLPAEWLEILDERRAKLPGFQAHNGTEAKRRATDAKRQARFRAAHSSAPPSRQSRTSVTEPLPDQTKTRPKPDTDQTGKGNGGTHAEQTPLQMHATLPQASWQEWLAYRRKRRFPIDPTTLGKHLAKLAQYPTEVQVQMIDASIGSGWQGIFDPKGKPPTEQPKPSTWQPPEDADAQH